MKHAKSSPREPRRKTPAGKHLHVQCKPTARSRLTNGAQLHIARLDGRGVVARRWRDLFRHYMAETGGKQEQLCRSIASIIVQREMLDFRLANGEMVDPLMLVRLSGEIRRLLSRLGLDEPVPEPLPADSPPWLIGEREAAS